MFRPVIGRAETDIFLNAFNEVVVVEALSSDRTDEQCSIVRHSSNTTRPLFAARMIASVLLLNRAARDGQVVGDVSVF